MRVAGKPATPAMLVDVPRLATAYYAEAPDFSVWVQRVEFGTSDHRGSAFDASFNEGHVLAISQAICQYRWQQGIDGPLFLGIDTHALPVPARLKLQGMQRVAYAKVLHASTIDRHDFLNVYETVHNV